MYAAQPIVPWIGGKRRLVPEILPLFPEHVCYVELFAGAAAVFFNKQPSRAEILNDINGDLINLYRVVSHHLEEFVRQFKWALSSRQIFEWHKMTRPETLTDIQRAARFYYLQQLSFGAEAEPASDRGGAVGRPPAPGQGRAGAPAVVHMHGQVRPSAHPVLRRSTLLGD